VSPPPPRRGCLRRSPRLNAGKAATCQEMQATSSAAPTEADGASATSPMSGDAARTSTRQRARRHRGVVGKWAVGPYHTDGRRRPWVKIKNLTYNQAEGRQRFFENRAETRQRWKAMAY
jgi:hypothetical protein